MKKGEGKGREGKEGRKGRRRKDRKERKVKEGRKGKGEEGGKVKEGKKENPVLQHSHAKKNRVQQYIPKLGINELHLAINSIIPGPEGARQTPAAHPTKANAYPPAHHAHHAHLQSGSRARIGDGQ